MASAPDPAFQIVEHQRLRTAGLCYALKHRFTELRARDFPDNSAFEALLFLEELLSALERRVAALRDERTLVLAGEVVVYLGRTLEYFDNAGTDQTPRGLVCLLRSLYMRLARPAKLLAWPQAEYNFTIRSLVDYLRDLFENLGSNAEVDQLFLSYKGPQELVSFPRVERDNVLMHAIFGHELGHEVATRFLEDEAKSTDYKAKESQIRQEVIAALGGSPTLPQLQSATEAVFNLRTRALEELISDCVGVLLFGPSALFAGHDILMWNELDVLPTEDGDCYPPGRMRIRVSLAAAVAEGHVDAMRAQATDPVAGSAFRAALALISRLEKLVAQTSDDAVLASDRFVKIAYAWVSSTLPHAQTFARAQIGGALYSSDMLQREVPKLVERLKDGLPPNEIGNSLNPTPVDERSAVLAAWLIQLGASQASPPSDFNAADLGRLQEKTLRGLEYIELQRHYGALKKAPSK